MKNLFLLIFLNLFFIQENLAMPPRVYPESALSNMESVDHGSCCTGCLSCLKCFLIYLRRCECSYYDDQVIDAPNEMEIISDAGEITLIPNLDEPAITLPLEKVNKDLNSSVARKVALEIFRRNNEPSRFSRKSGRAKIYMRTAESSEK